MIGKKLKETVLLFIALLLSALPSTFVKLVYGLSVSEYWQLTVKVIFYTFIQFVFLHRC